MSTPLQALQEKLVKEMPVSQLLCITVDTYENGCLTLTAPLQTNTNHTGTAFAGSLNAAVTLAGWGLLWLILDELKMPATIVIQDSSIHYRQPVKCDFRARGYTPDPILLEKMLKTLQKRGKARVGLHAEICQGDDVAVTFHGRYVIQLSSTETTS